jgi:hypothetical protein
MNHRAVSFSLRPIALLPAISLLAASVSSAAPELAPDAFQFASPAAIEGKTLAAAVPDDSILGELFSGLKSPIPQEPGVYRVTARVRPTPLNNMGYRIILTVRDANETKDWTRWRPAFSLLTPRAKEIWLGTDEKRAFQAGPDGVLELSCDVALVKAGRLDMAVGWKVGETMIGNEITINEAPASLSKLALESVTIKKLDVAQQVAKVMCDKLVYKPGAVPTLTVDCANTGAETAATLVVRASRDLEPSAEIARKEVTLPAEKLSFEEIALPALDQEGGYRFDVDLMIGDKVASRGERSAICSSSFNRVAIFGSCHNEYLTHYYNATEALTKQYFINLKESYLPWLEINFWAPDDTTNLDPKEEVFMSNVMTPQKKSHIQLAVQEGKKNGIGMFTYNKGVWADGRDGLKWAQRFPEVVLYHRDTGRPLGTYNMESLMNWDQILKDKVEGKVGSSPGGWYYALLDGARPSVADVAAEATIASMKTFGWDGVRFDGDFPVMPSNRYIDGPARNLRGEISATEDDAQLAWASAVQRYKLRVSKAFPKAEFGYNHEFNKENAFLTVVPTLAAGGGIVMQEAIRSHLGERHPQNEWKKFAEELSKYSWIIRSFGGYSLMIDGYGGRSDDYLYAAVYLFASQVKPFQFDASNPFRQRLTRFMARFSGLLQGQIYPVASPGSRFTVSSSSPLEWERFVGWHDASETKRQYVVHLINPPLSERAKGQLNRCDLRPPVGEIKVGFYADPNEFPARAYLLDPWDENDKVEIPVKTSQGLTTISLPGTIPIWKVLVIECEVKPFSALAQ